MLAYIASVLLSLVEYSLGNSQLDSIRPLFDSILHNFSIHKHDDYWWSSLHSCSIIVDHCVCNFWSICFNPLSSGINPLFCWNASSQVVVREFIFVSIVLPYFNWLRMGSVILEILRLVWSIKSLINKTWPNKYKIFYLNIESNTSNLLLGMLLCLPFTPF